MEDIVFAMTAKEAIAYCPLWGATESQADADFYNLDDKGRPHDGEEARVRMIEHIDDVLIPMAAAADWDDPSDREALPRLREYLAEMTFGDPKPAHVFAEPAEINGVPVAEVAQHYAIAMLWSSHDGGSDAPLDDIYSTDDIAPETWAKIESIVRAFLEKVGHLVTADNLVRDRSDATVAAMAGHDLWLTQVGHGSGFWDGDWASDAHTGSREGPMSAAAKAGGEFADPYVGGDGLIYLQ